MVDGASTLLSFLHGMHAAGRWAGARGTNLLDGGAPFYQTYETSDGRYMAVGAIEPVFYERLLQGLGLPSPASDSAHLDSAHLDPALWQSRSEVFARAFRSKTRDEWTAVFSDLDACVTPVLSPWEAHLHPHNAGRASFIEIDGVIQPAPAPRFSRTAPATPRPMNDGVDDPGAALADWGFDGAEVDALRAAGVLGRASLDEPADGRQNGWHD